MSTRQRLTFAAIAAAIAVAAFVVLVVAPSGDEPERASESAAARSTAGPVGGSGAGEAGSAGTEPQARPERRPRPRVHRIRIRDGEPVGGVRELEFDQGDRIRLSVESDVADHVHVHGYDLMKDVAPGRTATFSFRASITGIFEAELEDRGVPIASLRVNP